MNASQRRNALKNSNIYKGPTLLDVIADAITEGNATEALSSPKARREGGGTAEGGGESESRTVKPSNEPEQKQSGTTTLEKRGGKPQKGGEIRQSRTQKLRNGN